MRLALAARLIAYGDADVILAGGCEKPQSQLGIGGFSAMQALSTRNDATDQSQSSIWQRPWWFCAGWWCRRASDGKPCPCQNAGATILAEFVGFGMSDDASHITAPPENGEGAAMAMRHALSDAGIAPSDVGYINTHGTSTPAGDVAESRAIAGIFGENMVVSSTKSMTGHLLGAAGGIEAIFTVKALQQQILPPTINLDHQDPECKLDYTAYSP